MSMRPLIVILAAHALGCGAVQPAVGPEPEVLVDGFPPPHPAQQRPGKDGKCRVPEGWPSTLLTLIRNGACWTPLDATEAQCREAAKENPWHVWAEGRCWYWLPGGEKKREPTSSLLP
jgi:hypothetical protein